METIPYLGMNQFFDINYVDLEAIQKKILTSLKKKQNSRTFIFGVIVSLIKVKNDEDSNHQIYQSAKFLSFKKLASIDIIDSIKKLSSLCSINSKKGQKHKSEATVALNVRFMVNKPLRISAKTGLLTSTDAKFNSRTHGLLVIFKDKTKKDQIYFPKSFNHKKKWEAIQLDILKSGNYSPTALKGIKYFAFKSVEYTKEFFYLFANKAILNNIKNIYINKFLYSINNPYLKQVPYIQTRTYDYKHNSKDMVTNLQYLYHSLNIINELTSAQKEKLILKIKQTINNYINECLQEYQRNMKHYSNNLLPHIILLIHHELVSNSINVKLLIEDLLNVLKAREDKDIDISLIYILNALVNVSPMNMEIIKPEINKLYIHAKKTEKASIQNLFKSINFYYHLTELLLNFASKLDEQDKLNSKYTQLYELYLLTIDKLLTIYNILQDKLETDVLGKLFCSYLNLYNLKSIMKVKLSNYEQKKLEEIILDLFCKLEKHKNEHGFYKFVYQQKGESKLIVTARINDSIVRFKELYLNSSS